MKLRDTDQDWELMAKTEPYWAVLADKKYQGYKALPEQQFSEFFESGEVEISDLLKELESQTPVDGQLKSVIDFGCGVGRLLIPLAKRSVMAIGIDVSETMRSVAIENCQKHGVKNVSVVGSIKEALQQRSSFDLINSFIVFQHIPPNKGYEFLHDLVSSLRIGGIVCLQITFYKDRRFFDVSMRDVELFRTDGADMGVVRYTKENTGVVMSMYDYDMNKVLAIMISAGITQMSLTHTDHDGCHGVVIKGQRLTFGNKITHLQAGQEIVVSNISKQTAFFQSGWYDLEPWGRWAEGKEARLLFPILVNAVGEYELQIKCNVFISSDHLSQRVGVSLRVGEAVQSINYEIYEHVDILKFQFSVTDTSCPPLDLLFTLPDNVSPLTLGISQDARSLSIGVTSINLVKL